MSEIRRIAGITAGIVLFCFGSAVQADDLDLGAESAPSAIAWSGDLLLRQDILRSWPAGDNEARLLMRLRYGLNWQLDPQWLLGAALRINESTIGNEHLVDYNDNQRSRDLALDTLYLQYAPAEGQALEAGKDVFPLNLSRMLWDPDLRPAGLSYSLRQQLGDDMSLRFVAGAFLGQNLSGDQSRITAAQLGMRFHEQDTVQPEFILSYLRFTKLDPLLTVGEDRGNPFLNGRFIDAYELADLQFMLHVGAPIPFRLLVDLDKNLGAVAGNDRAGRIEMALGDSFLAGGNEVGVASERMQQSAVQGAFNDDDWWFHAGSHGVMLWYAYGWSERVRLRAAWFHEQPDDSWHHWNRWLLDLSWQL